MLSQVPLCLASLALSFYQFLTLWKCLLLCCKHISGFPQNCSWTQHTFPLPTPSPFCLALTSHYNCWLEFYPSNSALDPFPICLVFYSSHSNLSFVPYCSIVIVKVTKWPALVFFSQITHVLLKFLLETFISLCFKSCSFLISSSLTPLLSGIIWEFLFSNIDVLLCFFSGLWPPFFSLTCVYHLILLE